MKHLNLIVSIIFFICFIKYDTTWLSSFSLMMASLNLAEWLRYNIITEIKEYIDKKFADLK